MLFKLLRIAVVSSMLAVAGCGGGGGGVDQPQVIQAQILSDPGYDGDIEQTGPSSAIVTQGVGPNQSVRAGIDPGTGDEYRAFLYFPLGGTGGVPANARIDSAFLEVFINDVQPTGATIPVRVELVSFQQPMLATDFDRTAQPPLAYVTLSPQLGPADVGKYVPIDVTPLMIEAQRRGLAEFQVRILEDLGPPVDGIFDINDPTSADRGKSAPLLTVNYF